MLKLAVGWLGLRRLKCETGCFHDRYDNVLAPAAAVGGGGFGHFLVLLLQMELPDVSVCCTSRRK